jgi:hypothetical protein
MLCKDVKKRGRLSRLDAVMLTFSMALLSLIADYWISLIRVSEITILRTITLTFAPDRLSLIADYWISLICV